MTRQECNSAAESREQYQDFGETRDFPNSTHKPHARFVERPKRNLWSLGDTPQDSC
jgi:hypothetical protein